MKYFIECITKKYAAFSGRASRNEFWYFILFALISLIIVYTIEESFKIMPVYHNRYGVNIGIPIIIFFIALLLPTLAVGVRRLHDTSKNGWWITIALISPINIILLVWLCMDSKI